MPFLVSKAFARKPASTWTLVSWNDYKELLDWMTSRHRIVLPADDTLGGILFEGHRFYPSGDVNQGVTFQTEQPPVQ